MIQHPLSRIVLQQLFELEQKYQKEQQRLRKAKTPYTHQRQHKTLLSYMKKEE